MDETCIGEILSGAGRVRELSMLDVFLEPQWSANVAPAIQSMHLLTSLDLEYCHETVLAVLEGATCTDLRDLTLRHEQSVCPYISVPVPLRVIE